MNKFLIASGMWLFCDALYSILTYPQEKLWRNHSFRIMRGIIGICLIVIG